MKYENMTLEDMLKFAGVDTTQGKAKELVDLEQTPPETTVVPKTEEQK